MAIKNDFFYKNAWYNKVGLKCIKYIKYMNTKKKKKKQ